MAHMEVFTSPEQCLKVLICIVMVTCQVVKSPHANMSAFTFSQNKVDFKIENSFSICVVWVPSFRLQFGFKTVKGKEDVVKKKKQNKKVDPHCRSVNI